MAITKKNHAGNLVGRVEVCADLLYIITMIDKQKKCEPPCTQTSSKALHVIRDIFNGSHLDIEKILIFGSRARGDYRETSDWDFLVLSSSELPIPEKHRVITAIKRQLAKLSIPNDIIIQSRQKFEAQKHSPGNISFVANLEGVTL